MSKNKDNSAFHFFIYLVSFLALSFLATGIGAILFQIINKFFPDALRYGSGSFSQSAVKYGIASIIVAGPLYLYIMALINKYLKKGKILAGSTVRKWLTYIILFIAAAVIVIDLVTLIFNLLDGELAARVILKVLVVFVIAAAIFGYYFWEIRKKEIKDKRYQTDKISYVILLVAMVLVLASSFFVVDSPAVARDKKIDNQTTDDLSSISNGINIYFNEHKELPQTLDDLKSGNYYLPKIEPVGNISYQKISDKDYKLCADFKRSNANDTDEEWQFYEGWQHDSGRICFDKKVEEYEGKVMPIPVR